MFISTEAGQRFEVYFSEASTTKSLKMSIMDEIGAPPNYQTLSYNGIVLKDNDTLSSYGINQDSEINVAHNLNGGCGAGFHCKCNIM